jgi:hypothetical protein
LIIAAKQSKPNKQLEYIPAGGKYPERFNKVKVLLCDQPELLIFLSGFGAAN